VPKNYVYSVGAVTGYVNN